MFENMNITEEGAESRIMRDQSHENVRRMLDMLPEDQRELIEKLFKEELSKLGIEAVIERISEAKKRQDNTRAICEANGAFKSTFEEEGWKIEDLAVLKRVDIESVRQMITDEEIKKDRILRESDNGKQ